MNAYSWRPYGPLWCGLVTSTRFGIWSAYTGLAVKLKPDGWLYITTKLKQPLAINQFSTRTVYVYLQLTEVDRTQLLSTNYTALTLNSLILKRGALARPPVTSESVTSEPVEIERCRLVTLFLSPQTIEWHHRRSSVARDRSNMAAQNRKYL